MQIVLHAHGAEQLAALRHEREAEADAFLDAEAVERGALEGDAAGGGQNAHGGVEQRGLAGAVGADDGDDAAGLDGQRDVAHGLDLAVGDGEAVDGEDGRAHVTPPR